MLFLNHILNLQHEIILGILILSIGSLAGYVNFLKRESENLKESEKLYVSKQYSQIRLRYILSGVGAAILVPLFLNMLSSNLIKVTSGFENTNYFVFAGFCFIAGYFSDRFIDTIGDRILKELEQTKNKVNSTNEKLEQTTQALQENEDKIDVLVDNETDFDEDIIINQNLKNDIIQMSTQTDDDLSDQTFKIIKSFNDKYKFRTIKGIANELNYSPTIVQFIMDGLEKQAVVKKLSSSNGNIIWALTKIGQNLKNI
jgi:hypothetical protein